MPLSLDLLELLVGLAADVWGFGKGKVLPFSSEEDYYIRLDYGNRRVLDLVIIYLARTKSSIRQRAKVLGAVTSRR